MSYKIISNGGGYGHTRIIDTVTGHELRNVAAIEWCIDAQDMIGSATVRLIGVEIDADVEKDGVVLEDA